MEALGIPKQCLIQKLIIFNYGGYYIKYIFKIKFCRIPIQKMSLWDGVYITLEILKVSNDKQRTEGF